MKTNVGVRPVGGADREECVCVGGGYSPSSAPQGGFVVASMSVPVVRPRPALASRRGHRLLGWGWGLLAACMAAAAVWQRSA